MSSADVLPHSATKTKESSRWAAALTSTTGKIGGRSTMTYSYRLRAVCSVFAIVGEFNPYSLFGGLIRVEAGRKSNLCVGSELIRSLKDDPHSTPLNTPDLS